MLLLAFGLRAALALNTLSIDDPDEVFQYLEPAHRLVFKWGFVPWEYQYGIRSWIIPGFVAGILQGLRALGLTSPLTYQPVIKLVFCLASLSIPLSVYRITQATVGERAARIAVVLAAVWYELVYYAHKPLADALGAYALYGALAVLLTGSTRRAYAGFGALCGLTIALRYQLAPAVVVMLAIAAWRWRWRGLWAAGGMSLVIAGAGLLDAYTWGRPFSSIWSNFQMNAMAGVADGFGDSSPVYYLQVLVVTSLALVVPGVIGLWRGRRTTWPLIAVGLVTLIAFSIIGHKQPRFIFALIPLYLIGLGAWAAVVTAPGASRVQIVAARCARAAPALAATVSVAGILWLLPFEDRIYAMPIIDRDDLREAYLTLSDAKDVSGVIDQSNAPWWRSGGYFDLNCPAPIYRPDLPATWTKTLLAAPDRYASHWLTPSDAPAPRNYYRLRTIGKLTIWRRAHDLGPPLTPPGYTTRVAVSGPIAPPTVVARW